MNQDIEEKLRRLRKGTGQGGFRSFCKAHRILVGLASIGIAVVMAVSIYAAAAWPSRSLPAGGTVTVNSPVASTVAPNYDFTVTGASYLDFSGSLTSGEVYTKTVSVTVNNTGTDGSSPFVSAAIPTGVVATVTSGSLPSGWTLSGSTGPIVVGGSATLTITLSSVNPVSSGTIDLGSFTVGFTAS